jgi:hypothetical protein
VRRRNHERLESLFAIVAPGERGAQCQKSLMMVKKRFSHPQRTNGGTRPR